MLCHNNGAHRDPHHRFPYFGANFRPDWRTHCEVSSLDNRYALLRRSRRYATAVGSNVSHLDYMVQCAYKVWVTRTQAVCFRYRPTYPATFRVLLALGPSSSRLGIIPRWWI